MNPASTAPSPLALPRLTRNEAQARSQLAQRAKNCALRLVDQDWLASLEPISASLLDSASLSDKWLIRADWAGASFEIGLPVSACQTWLSARFVDLDLPTLPQAMAAALLETALASLLESLQAQQKGPARLSSLSTSVPPGARPVHCFALMLRRGPQSIIGWLATDSLGLMLLAGLTARMPAATNAIDTDVLPLALLAEIGVSDLPAQVFTQLTPGDTVLVQQPWIHQNGELWLGRGDWGIRVRWEDVQLVVTATFGKTGFKMASNTDAGSEADGRTSLDAIPVRLSFDLGERRITLGELKALQLGQTLELGRPLSQGVTVRANGSKIGMGELIEVDGRLGVTLTSLSEARAGEP